MRSSRRVRLTTTGATVLTGHRCAPFGQPLAPRTQLAGRHGIIVLAVAILPLLFRSGMQIYKAETPGPMKDSPNDAPHRQTAKALWLVYFGITAACIASLKLAGMSWLDAICHTFSTLSLGGFSTLRRQFRTVQFAPDRRHPDRLHAAAGDEFRHPLRRLARPQSDVIGPIPRPRFSSSLIASSILVCALYLWGSGPTRLRGRAAPRCLQSCLDCDRLRIRQRRFRPSGPISRPSGCSSFRVSPSRRVPPAAESR